jgi:acyl carrier protein
VLQQDDLSAEQNLYELGADSLSIVDILIRCEDELDITVPLERFARVRTATEMSDLIRTVQMEAGGIQR